MGQLDGVPVQGDEAGGGEAFQHVLRVGPQLRSRCGAAGVGRAVSGCDQPQQDTAGDAGLLRRELAVDLFGGAGDRAPHASRLLVRGQGEGASAAPAPGLQQGVRDHRQGPGLVGDLVDDAGGQHPLHVQALGGRGAGDRVPQLVPVHRSDQQVRAADRLGQPRVGAAVAVEVTAYGDGHAQSALRSAGAQQQVEEAIAFRPVVAEGEQFLELVDDHPGVQVTVLGDESFLVRTRGPLPGRDHPDHRRAVGALGLPQHRDQTGPQQRRLATAGGAEHGREPACAHQLQQLADLFVPAEEQVAVTWLVAGQPPVRGPVLGRGRPHLRIRLPPVPLPLVRVGVQYPGVRPHHRQ